MLVVKKLSQSITILLLMLVFVGCSNDKEVSSSESSTNQSTSHQSGKDISENLTLYEIFNIGENSMFVGRGVVFYHLLDVDNGISKDSQVAHILTIDYENKEITTYMYGKENRRGLSEFLKSDSWTELLFDDYENGMVSEYKYPKKDSDKSIEETLHFDLFSDPQGNIVRAELIEFSSEASNSKTGAWFKFLTVGSIEKTEIYGNEIKGYWGAKTERGMSAIVTPSLNSYNLVLDDLDTTYNIDIDDLNRLDFIP
ncbi:hypothetical protein [Vagococcus fluvialis]|uniref:hypothetical protein n=1 Tax=Vagococcus fluvialis TaxID=2738 RepID=UPI003D0B9B57